MGSVAEAAPVDATARYVVSLGGLNFAVATISFRTDGRAYQIDIGAKVSGIASLVASGSASANSAGTTRGGTLLPNEFSFETKAASERFDVAVQYSGGNTSGFQIDPPIENEIGRVALERRQLRGVTDPVASFILKGDKLDAGLCQRKLHIFSGMERYDIQMSYGATQAATSERTGYQGPVVLCKLQYVPISGHYENSDMTRYLAKSDRLLIWYAPLGQSNYYIPYRVIMGTNSGDLSMVLTDLSGPSVELASRAE